MEAHTAQPGRSHAPRKKRGVTATLRGWMESKNALWGVFAASLAETTVVPIPIEVALIPVMLTNRDRLWRTAGAALAGCLVGASIGYFIGYGAYSSVGRPFIESLGLTEDFTTYRDKLNGNGFWYVLMAALTPIPFQIAYLGAGVVQLAFWKFIAAAILGRGVRYFGLAVLVAILGRAAGPWLERNQFRIAIGATALFIGGYILYQVISS